MMSNPFDRPQAMPRPDGPLPARLAGPGAAGGPVRPRIAALLMATLAAAPVLADRNPPATGTSAGPPVAQPGAALSNEQTLLARLKRLYPTSTFSSVSRTPLPGIYEVVTGSGTAYVGEDGRHFLYGQLFDLQRGQDPAAGREGVGTVRVDTGTPAARPARIDPADLPLRDAIVRSHGTGARRLVVFLDPHSAPGKRLDADLLQLTDTTVYTLLVPMQGWEAREAALRHWAVHMPARALETQVVDQNLRLARRLGIRATPTLVRADGQVMEGVMTLPELGAWLDGKDSVAQSAQGQPAVHAGVTAQP
jgi:thiol:disulfide interchange protein DsbC